MTTAIYVMAGLIVLVLFYFIWQMVKPYRKFQGKMLVTCPETHQTAGVAVDARHVALTAVRGEPDLRLKECTRWPERQNCGQECLAQIELSPENCLVRTMLANWYKGKSCVFCGKAFQQVDSYDHRAVFLYDQKPALLSPEGQLVEWRAVPVETLPQILTTHKPVCWNCLIAMTFRRDHPELVTDRPFRGRN
ncbi:MAG: hypothetical protein L6R45_31070 [Anaerolineae bacterium]|nr:hypothetical protein [Anaerolineae bacterium]